MKHSRIKPGELDERKKADRAKMAAAVIELAESMGATVEVEREQPGHPYKARRISLTIRTPGGAYLPAEFDGDSCQPGVHVWCWNTELDSLFAFSGAMGDVNPHHFAKAQRVWYGLEEVLFHLRRDLEALMSGRGYSVDRARKLAEGRRKSLTDASDYLAPIVAAGEGTTWNDGTECQSAEQVRENFERIPTLIAETDSFIAAGCPMEGAQMSRRRLFG